MGEPQTIPQSIIYQLVNETINKSANNLSLPPFTKCDWSYVKQIGWYILMMPLTHL